MTALKEYERLEASGLWRSDPEAQRRDVVVSIGEATLTISDFNNQALTHWSLAAIGRLNPGERPALFHPDGDAGETLEIPENEGEMIDAIERLRKAVDRARPRSGRLRLLSILGVTLVVAAFLWLWLPGALQTHVTSVVPEVTQKEIGLALLGEIEKTTGPACRAPGTGLARRDLAKRLGVDQLIVLPASLPGALALPGGFILIGRDLVETYQDPGVVAGFIISEQVLATQNDPLSQLLESGGMTASFSLLTQGVLPADLLHDMAQVLLSTPQKTAPESLLLSAFKTAQIASTPYAYALDPTGESTLSLIEADPVTPESNQPVLKDRDWVLLQGICEG